MAKSTRSLAGSRITRPLLFRFTMCGGGFPSPCDAESCPIHDSGVNGSSSKPQSASKNAIHRHCVTFTTKVQREILRRSLQNLEGAIICALQGGCDGHRGGQTQTCSHADRRVQAKMFDSDETSALVTEWPWWCTTELAARMLAVLCRRLWTRKIPQLWHQPLEWPLASGCTDQ